MNTIQRCSTCFRLRDHPCERSACPLTSQMTHSGSDQTTKTHAYSGYQSSHKFVTTRPPTLLEILAAHIHELAPCFTIDELHQLTLTSPKPMPKRSVRAELHYLFRQGRLHYASSTMTRIHHKASDDTVYLTPSPQELREWGLVIRSKHKLP